MNNTAFQHLYNNFLDLLYPPSCVCCHKNLSGYSQKLLCSECYDSLVHIKDNSCYFCGSPLGKYAKRTKQCDICRNISRSYTRVIAAVEYNEIARKMILSYKFYNRKHLCLLMAREMLQRIFKEYSEISFDYILPVPLHKKKYAARGYNQSELLAHYISDNLNFRLKTDLLIRMRNTPPQSLLDSAGRETNLKDAFIVTREIAKKRILLIDDVLTTGCTASECAKALRMAGAERIYVAVFAR